MYSVDEKSLVQQSLPWHEPIEVGLPGLSFDNIFLLSQSQADYYKFIGASKPTEYSVGPGVRCLLILASAPTDVIRPSRLPFKLNRGAHETHDTRQTYFALFNAYY